MLSPLTVTSGIFPWKLNTETSNVCFLPTEIASFERVSAPYKAGKVYFTPTEVRVLDIAKLASDA
jgi:hypothetical protein